MADRSRLQVGVDVPWVTSWSQEKLLGVRPCPTAGGAPAVWQAERPGRGRPNYSANHFRRQRASVRDMLCPMCGRATPQDDRWTQTAKRTAAGALRRLGLAAALPTVIADDQVLVNAGAIAPLHLACARRSAERCPHLSADPALDTRRFPARWVVIPLFVSAAPHVLAAPPPPAVGFLQLCGLTGDRDPAWRERPGEGTRLS